MKLTKKLVIDYLIGYIFILIMVGSATVLHDSEVILPEIGALTVGLWIYKEQNWVNEPKKIFFIPSLTALIGFGLNRLLLPYSFKILMLLLLMVILLIVAKSVLAPAFATGLLPIIVNATHYSFMISILIFTFILMVVVRLRGISPKVAVKPVINKLNMFIFLMLAVIWVLIVTILGHPQMAAIPPVFVVFFEVLQKPMYPGKMAIKQIIALTAVAALSVVAYTYIESRLIVILIMLPIVFIILQLLKVKIPAAYAFPLLAVILPYAMFQSLPLATFFASCYFFGTAYLYHKFIVSNG
ncbi:hypothetical protein ACVQ8P_06210 [Dellaglioa sp. BT-FLS60]